MNKLVLTYKRIEEFLSSEDRAGKNEKLYYEAYPVNRSLSVNNIQFIKKLHFNLLPYAK